jgi:hypothetical protein
VPSAWPHGPFHMNRILGKGGWRARYAAKVGFNVDFGGFFPLLGDLEPFLRPDLGGKLGGEPQLKSYKKQRFLIA